MRWDTVWLTLKDVALTGTGAFLIVSQVFSPAPSDILLATGLALTVPSVAGHVKALIAGPGPPTGGPSSPSSPSSTSSPSSPSAAATNGAGGGSEATA